MLALPGITVRVRRRRGRDKWRKEVHFFDQWPLGTSHDYVNCFPPEPVSYTHLTLPTTPYV